MVAPRRRRISTGVAAICGAFLLIPTVGAVEVESDPIEERTEAALADFRSAMKLEPNLQHGARLYTKCAACHAPNGLGTRGGSVPAIAAQHVSVLVKQLVDFRHDRRWGEQMRNVASQHYLEGPQELLDVASHAESLPRWPPLEGGTCDGLALNQGYVVYHRYCAECHCPLGLGELRRMRPGMDVEHVKLIGALTAEERRSVANYLSRLSPDLTSTQDKPISQS